MPNPRVLLLLLGLGALLLCPVLRRAAPHPAAARDPQIMEYDAARMPGLACVAGRVIAETDPRLSAAQRRQLWRDYGLRLGFEWIVPQSGFTYHELEIRPWNIIDRALARATGRSLPPRELPALIALLTDDKRLHWAAPDALLLAWDAQPTKLDDLPQLKDAIPNHGAVCLAPDATQPAPYGVTLIDDQEQSFTGGLAEWAKHPDWPEPRPDFEYYRLCDPRGTAIPWAPELAGNAEFMRRCATLYGTGQARALAAYSAAGAPALAPVTVCVADTGVYFNHPDLAGRMHPNAIDLNYTSYRLAAASDRPAADMELRDRGALQTTGLPRPAIKGQPAAHGTCTAGLVARCTAGFASPASQVRLLPASLKSDRPFAIVGTRIKTPISAFIKLVAALYENFPTGSFTPAADARVQNTGDVRVVTTSASIPRTYFSDAQWKVVSSLANKGGAAVLEDQRVNDRLYLFASGNEAQSEPNKPCELDSVIAVSATMAFDPARPWYYPDGEGANTGMKCVSAPGHGIITSTLYATPNLAYLPVSEIPQPRDNVALPPRAMQWIQQTNRFCATSSATPQVAALAALLYAQTPQRTYRDVIKLIEDSTAGRIVDGKWGQARGLIDYAAALGW
jgi:subtilisin family serine protease